MQVLDRMAINEYGIPGMVLMENAGRAVFEKASELYNRDIHSGAIVIYCGKGNNGGDGYVVARYFQNSGFPVEVISICDPETLSGDALTNARICIKLGISIRHITGIAELDQLQKPGLIIDALLGTGIRGFAKGLIAELISFINSCDAPVMSVDIPTGLSGDFMTVPGPVVKAEFTVTMALPKRAHIFEPARSFVGELIIADIGIPLSVQTREKIRLMHVEARDIILPRTAGNENKYSAGKLFILAGSPGMTGAATLSALGALHMGTGLVVAGIPMSLNSIMEIKLTEALTQPLPETSSGSLSLKGMETISERIDWSNAVLIGPGLGRDPETLQLVMEVFALCNASTKPVILDADALFAISSARDIQQKMHENVLLTPHHGEFIRLSNASKKEMATEPWTCVQAFLKDKSCVVNLKGSPSLVSGPTGTCFVNGTGNPVLAKGGSGDVLAGMCAGLMARGIPTIQAAITGNYLHGLAADLMAGELGIASALPGDLFKYLPGAIKTVNEKIRIN